MEKLRLILICLTINLSFGQTYNGVNTEKSSVDRDNAVYELGKRFVFDVEISDSNNQLFIKENDLSPYSLTNQKDSAQVSQVHLTVIKPKLFQRTNKNQTEILYSYEPHSRSIATTGLVENKTNVWMHPPREGFFRQLQTCPFPYIKLDTPIGFEWSDSLNAGDHYSDESTGIWEGNKLLSHKYTIAQNETVIINLGSIDCTVINATASSDLGESHLTAYYSDQYGFVKLEYITLNQTKICLMLSNIVVEPILRSTKDYWKENSNKLTTN